MANVAKCPSCRNKVQVPPQMAGRNGRCPVCDAPMTFPADPSQADKVRFTCVACQVQLSATPDVVGKTIRCPKCGRPTPVHESAQQKGDDLAIQELKQTSHNPKTVRREAYLAWAEHEKTKKDSYYVALLRSFGYPIKAMGVVLFFVVGIPIVSVLLRQLFEHLIRLFPTTDQGDFNYVATGVVVASLLAGAACAALFASLIFSTVRVSARGSGSVPVIQGARHRINLSTFVAWLAVFFGPGAFVGFRTAPTGQLFELSGPAAVLLLLGALLAPGALLMGANHGGNKVFAFGDLFRAIGDNFGDYCYLLLMIGVSAGIFGLAGYLLNRQASAIMFSENPNTVLSMVLSILAGCCYVFPLVAAARMIGLFAKHHEETIPFDVKTEGEFKPSAPASAMMLVALALLFLPLNGYAQTKALQAGIITRCLKNLHLIRFEARHSGGGTVRYEWPRDEANLLTRFPSHAVCPLAPDQKVGYAVETFEGEGEPADAFLVIYDKAGNHPGGTRNAVTVGGRLLKGLPEEHFQRIMKVQRALMENPEDVERENRLRQLRLWQAPYIRSME
jgi:hypothetical protein